MNANMNSTLVMEDDTEKMFEEKNNQSVTITCPVVDYEIIGEINLWVNGVALLCVAIVGLFLNFVAVHILATRNSLKNNFNSLLISLFCFDSIYLLLQVVAGVQILLEKDKKNYYIITILAPHLLWPMSSVTLTASIFMTVGIAHERYVAIKNPIKHRQSMGSARIRRNRLLKYISLTILSSLAINAVKFFELELVWESESAMSKNDSDLMK